MKVLQNTLYTLFVVVVLAFASLWGIKEYIEGQAKNQIADFVEKSASYENMQARLMNSTLYVFENFDGDTPSTSNVLAGLQEYVTDPRLPLGFKTDSAAFSVLNTANNNEKSKSEILRFVLKQQGIAAHEWQVIAPHAIKNAVVVQDKDGAFQYLDPTDGVIAMFENQILIGPYAARSLISEGTPYQEVFIKLSESSDTTFYEDFAHVMMAPPNYPVYVNVAAPVYEGEAIVLGQLDGSAEDVAKDSSNLDLTPYLDYIGNKHEAQVQRSIYFTDPARVTIVLTDAIDPQALRTNIQPQVDGNKLVFEVPEDEALILDNQQDAGKAFAKKGQFIPIDQIIIEHL